MAGTCECGNEPSRPIKCGEFFLTTRKQVIYSRRTLPRRVSIYSISNVKTNDLLDALRTFFVIFIYGYAIVLCSFDAIMHKESYEYEWFVLRYYFHITLTCWNLFLFWYVRFLCYYCVNYMTTLKLIICCWLYVASIVLGTLVCRLPESILCNWGCERFKT